MYHQNQPEIALNLNDNENEKCHKLLTASTNFLISKNVSNFSEIYLRLVSLILLFIVKIPRSKF